MSWNIYLVDDRGHLEYEANYTHNVNRMIAAAITTAMGRTVDQCDGPLGLAIGPMWWKELDDMDGKEGRAYLQTILNELKSNPDRYRAMNPPNGWGDYDSLVKVLGEAIDAVPNWPCTWETGG